MPHIFVWSNSQNNEVVEELDLADNCIGSEGARCLASTIAASAKLKRMVSRN